MICKQCGNEQAGGNFCGKCGARLNGQSLGQTANFSESETGQPAGYAQGTSTQVNEHVERVKKQSKLYGSYFVNYLKRPSFIFGNEQNEWTNGLISIVLFVFIAALTASVFVRNIIKSAMHHTGDLFAEFYNGPSFFSVFFNVFLYAAMILILVLLCLFLVNKFFGSNASFKEMIAIYGAHLTAAIIIAVIAFLLILLKSNVYGNILLGIAFLLAVLFIPYYMISSLLTKYAKGIDPLYSFLLYVVIFAIVFSIFIGILADSALGKIADQWSYFW